MKDEDRFVVARRGDSLLAPFQCDLCWFVNLQGRLFDERRPSDHLNMALIRRVNLDMFWSKESSTVQGMYRVFEQNLKAAVHLGLKPSFMRDRKGWPLEDKVGFGEASLILWQSLQKGRNSVMGQQFDSIRKLRSLSSGMAAARPSENIDGPGFKDKGRAFSLGKCGVDSALFCKFIKGCEKRMGRIVKQDMGLSVEILLAILQNLEDELDEEAEVTDKRKREIVMLGACLVVGYCDALRGNEIFLVESSHLCQYYYKGKAHSRPHVIIPLMGRFKGETGERNVLRVLVETTKSGIQIGRWVERLVKILMAEKRNDTGCPGPAFCDEKGMVLTYSRVNGWFHDELVQVQNTHSGLIQPEIDVTETYNIYRSLRRGATSRASELNYTETLINLNNRWRSTQTNKGKGGLQKMSQLYVEISLVLKNLLAFSASL